MSEKRREYRKTEAQRQRSYDIILEHQIGRPSDRARKHRKKTSLVIMSFVMTAFVLSFLIIAGPDLVEASDGKETVKEFICVKIKEGDCLWSIAREHMSDDFSSEKVLMHEIAEINGLDRDTILKPGNQIMVPCYRTVSTIE